MAATTCVSVRGRYTRADLNDGFLPPGAVLVDGAILDDVEGLVADAG
jgi:hypothetical protein